MTRPEAREGPSGVRRSLPQSEMCSILMVVADVVRKQPLQMPLIHRHHVVQQISPAAGDAVLPGTLKRSPDRNDPQRSNCRGNLDPVLPIPIKQEEFSSR
jgi:hypothetical protein